MSAPVRVLILRGIGWGLCVVLLLTAVASGGLAVRTQFDIRAAVAEAEATGEHVGGLPTVVVLFLTALSLFCGATGVTLLANLRAAGDAPADPDGP